MNTLTIPKSLIKNDDLIVLPRLEYEKLLRTQKSDNFAVKRSASFKIKKSQEKFYDELDKDLTRIVREVRHGKVSDSFNTAREAIEFLNSRKKSITNKYLSEDSSTSQI